MAGRIEDRPDAQVALSVPRRPKDRYRSLRSAIQGACLALLAGVAVASSTAASAQDKLAEIIKDKRIRVGILESYNPFGFRDPSGKIIGLDADLAALTGKTLGVEVELVPATSANRMQLLQQGRIDVIIGGMGDTPDRRKIVGIVEPHYFISGANILAKKGSALKDWAALRGKTLCVKQGLSYIRMAQEEFGAKMLSFADIPEALQALRNGRCEAMLVDDLQGATLVNSPEWADWEMPLASRSQTGWSVGVPLQSLDQPFGRMMAGLVYQWHTSGKLIELSEKWGLSGNRWLAAMKNTTANDIDVK